MHVPELCRICRMGADITVQGHCAVVRGGTRLTGAEVMATVSLLDEIPNPSERDVRLGFISRAGAARVAWDWFCERGYAKRR